MIVKRMQEKATKYCKVGDIIEFELNNGENVEAMAVDEIDNSILFCFVDCLKTEYPMNQDDTNRGGYAESDLRKILNTEILDRFPEELRECMVPFENGDFLRIPTEKEIFRENVWGEKESKAVKQWKPMKLRRNRIAFGGSNGNLQWYWLQNPAVASSASFATCSSDGIALFSYASNSFGVRPVFLIR